jgi:outer membrane putative beta-barrel porin/alpha-amylase
VGVKVRLNATSRPELAVLLLTTVPIGGKDLTADAWQPTVKLAAAWDLTDRFSLSSNLNVSSQADGSDRFSQVAASLSAGFALTDRLGAFLETYGFSEETQGGPATKYVDGGFSYGVTNDLSLDVRAGAGLNDASPDYFIGAGGAIRW